MSPLEEHWLALHLVEGLGAKTLSVLLEHFEDTASLLSASPKAISEASRVRPALAERIATAMDAPHLPLEIERVKRNGARVIPMSAPEYPQRLKGVNFPPVLLYCRGAMPEQESPVLAVVGTRNHTRYGERVVGDLISGLADVLPPVVIVSGLARGIDSVAHSEALANGLPTLAILGGGLGRVYPKENLELAQRVAEGGALLSEFPMDARPLGRNFPVRNRVISGMSDAVLVVEAGEKSGALITAGFAMNYQRPVFAVPGNLGQQASAGTNRLIHEGQAALVRDAQDLLEALAPGRGIGEGVLGVGAIDAGILPAKARSVREPGKAPSSVMKALEGEKKRIAEVLKVGPMHPDELSGELGLPIEKLIGLLLELELSGDIYQTSDNQYMLA
ncbi:MAG: DNA-processing protein DprA [bacterium]